MEQKELSGRNLELASDDTSSKEGMGIEKKNPRLKVGKLNIPEFWEDYECLFSDNLFTVLALDIWDYEEYDDETIEQHHTEINRFLSNLIRLKDMGITFRDMYPKLNIEFAQHKAEEAYTRLKTFQKRREYYKVVLEEKKRIGRERLERLIMTIVADDRVSIEESFQFIDEATFFKFTEAEAAGILLEEILHRGFKPCKPYRAESSHLNKLLSTDFELPNSTQVQQSPTQPIIMPRPSPLMTVEDLLESGMIEEYIESGGTTKGEKWADFYHRTSKMFELHSIIELKQLIESKIPKALVEMVLVEGGIFKMGSNDDESDEEPQHEVTVSSYFIAKTQITQELWQSLMRSNPSKFVGSKKPVDFVSWYDAVDFCNKLSEREGLRAAYKIEKTQKDANNTTKYDDLKWLVTCNLSANGYRLPTEAEWEFAARGGNKSRGYRYSGSDDIEAVAWYRGNFDETVTHDVGTKQPNELGIYDMSGNVSELCWDWYSDKYYNSSSPTNPKGPLSGIFRVSRGGSWINGAESCRVEARSTNFPIERNVHLGVRVVRTKN